MTVPAAVTRFEVIDHRTPHGLTGVQTGRVFSARGCRIELSYQDGGKTLKVFVDGVRAEPSPAPLADKAVDFAWPQDVDGLIAMADEWGGTYIDLKRCADDLDALLAQASPETTKT